MKLVLPLLLLFLLLPSFLLAQEPEDSSHIKLDSLYREDQIYLGFNYNILTDMPQGVSASGFSGGIQAGLIRDFPLNDRRNIAIGAGLGWSINTYGQDLFIGEEVETGETIFLKLGELDLNYDRNRFTVQSVDIPLQFRWRTSTAGSHKFWRVYTGLRFGYAYYFTSTFEQPGNSVTQTKVPEFNRFRMGATFAFGYNTFNFQVYYGLNSFFKENASLGGERIGMNSLQVGMVFYIL